MSGPPVFDFSDDQAAFDAHLQAEFAKPCPHCDQIAPTFERLSLKFAIGRPPTEVICAACGERRATFHPTR